MCGLDKPYDHFYKYQNRSGNLVANSRCRDCNAIYCKQYYRHLTPDKRSAYLERSRIVSLEWRHQIRREMINAYGGRCVCCNEKGYPFLTIEHCFGGGHAERRKHGNFYVTMRKLKKLGWPPTDKYTILCYNCNMATSSGNPCPHGNYQRLTPMS